MQFSLNDDQQALTEGVRRYLADCYGFDARQAAVSARSGIDKARWAEIVELGLIGLSVSEAGGGLGQSMIEAMLVQGEIGKALVVEPVGECAVAATMLDRHGTGRLRAELLPRVLDGSCIAVLAHTEARSSCLPTVLQTRAMRDDRGYRLSGAKSVVVGGADADLLLVSAMGEEGPLLALVPRDAPGVSVTALELTDDRLAADIVLADVHVDADFALAPPAAWEAYDLARLALCADMVGSMDASLAMTCQYLGVRQQFGQPLAGFQSLQHRVADMYVELEQARSALLAGLAAMIHAEPGERHLAVTAAAVQVGFGARFVGGQAVQLHGGIGMTEEYAIGHFFRRLSVSDRLYGNADEQLAILADAMPAAAPGTDQSAASSQARNAEMCGASA